MKSKKDKDASDDAVPNENANTNEELTDLANGLTATPAAEETPQAAALPLSDKKPEERAEQMADLQGKSEEIRDDTEEIVQEKHPELSEDKPRAQRDFEEQRKGNA